MNRLVNKAVAELFLLAGECHEFKSQGSSLPVKREDPNDWRTSGPTLNCLAIKATRLDARDFESG